MEAIPTSPPRKGKTPFKASPPALRTQQLVGLRSLATLMAASIPLPARGRFFSTPQTQIRRLARRRFYSTPPASTTPPLERPPLLNNTIGEENTATGIVRSLATQPAGSTRPTALARSISTPPAKRIRRLVFMPSLSTPPVAENTATGYHALYSNTTGNFNTANGVQRCALSTPTGNVNTAIGVGRF